MNEGMNIMGMRGNKVKQSEERVPPPLIFFSRVTVIILPVTR